MEAKALGNMWAPIKACAIMCKAEVQAVLLYGRKPWAVTDAMMKVLDLFHNSITRHITGMTERKGGGREWEWALVDAELETTSIRPIREYVRMWQETITEYVAGIPI